MAHLTVGVSTHLEPLVDASCVSRVSRLPDSGDLLSPDDSHSLGPCNAEADGSFDGAPVGSGLFLESTSAILLCLWPGPRRPFTGFP